MLREFIPGTQARRDRLFAQILEKQSADLLIELEFRDGSVQLVPGVWNDDYDRYETPSGRPVVTKGEGQVQRIAGVEMIRAYAPSYARVSTEAAVMGTALDSGDFDPLDPSGEEIDVPRDQVDLTDDDPLGDIDPGDLPDDVAADGGTPEVANVRTDIPGAAYQFELDKALKYDPYPVSSNEAATAVDIAEKAGEEEDDRLKIAAIGAGVGAGIVLLALFVFWLLGQLGGGGGQAGGGGGTALGFLLLWGAPLRPTNRTLDGIGDVATRIREVVRCRS